MNLEESIVLRPYAQTDISFILDSWYRSYLGDMYSGVSYNKRVAGDKVFPVIHTIATALLSRCGAYIACDAEDYDNILGYVVGERIQGAPVIHWLYVKHLLRNNGVGKMLFRVVNPKHQDTLVTFMTEQVRDRCNNYPLIYKRTNLERILQLDCTPLTNEPLETVEGA